MHRDHLFDKRILERNLQKGQITEKDLEKHLVGLPDQAAKATFVDYSAEALESDAED